MTANATLRHIIVNVAPAQLRAIDRDAKRAGSRRAVLQSVTQSYLLKPTELIAGGIYRKPDRIRLRFHIPVPLHRALTKYALARGVPMTVVVTTAIANRYPV